MRIRVRTCVRLIRFIPNAGADQRNADACLQGTPVTVTYSAPLGGTSHTDVVTTDSTGFFGDSYGPDIGGTWTVTESFAGDATRAPSQHSCSFTALGG